MILEKPTVTDYVDCLTINRECFVDEERAPDGVFLNSWDNGTVFVHRENGKILGFAIVTRQAGVPFLWVIAVKPGHHGGGIGGNLLYEIWSWAKSKGERRIELTVKSSNPAQKLYFDSGYRVVKFLRNYYIGGGDGLLMRRII
jgi:ribosomal protein S18 acetylase RimI-like enzyme